MGNPSKFYFVVEKKSAKDYFKHFLNIAQKKGGSVKMYGDKRYEIAMHSMTYYFHTDAYEQLPNCVVYGLGGVATPNEKIEDDFLKFCFDACAELDPVFAVAGGGIGVYEYGPAWCGVEHYRNPYLLCLEPLKDKEGYDATSLYKVFINNPATLKKIDEIKRVLPLKELIKLLNRYCNKVSIGKKGSATVLKKVFPGDRNFVSLRFYLAKEIRKRGVTIEEGTAEERAKEIGIR